MATRCVRPTVIAIAFIASIAASAVYAENDTSKMNYGDTCAAEGRGPGTDQHRSCINEKVIARCAAANSTDTAEYRTCVKDENSRAFAQDMVGRYGY